MIISLSSHTFCIIIYGQRCCGFDRLRKWVNEKHKQPIKIKSPCKVWGGLFHTDWAGWWIPTQLSKYDLYNRFNQIMACSVYLRVRFSLVGWRDVLWGGLSGSRSEMSDGKQKRTTINPHLFHLNHVIISSLTQRDALYSTLLPHLRVQSCCCGGGHLHCWGRCRPPLGCWPGTCGHPWGPSWSVCPCSSPPGAWSLAGIGSLSSCHWSAQRKQIN